MDEYQTLVEEVLRTGNYKPNRTGVDTVSSFSHHYTIDLSEGFPLLTTKEMSGFRWNSMIHELFWYFSGEEHIKTLREETKIWDAWADEEGLLETAYGRFWRRFPIPEDGPAQLPGEAWADESCQWVTREDDGRLVFDQIQYVLDTLSGDNPDKGPNSRRLVISAWQPANAAVSMLPPCHYTFVINVQGDKLNLHLTQRSGDIALGIPFNIAAYALIATLIAKQTGFELGEFGHTIVDAHVYAGAGERGEWYAENLDELQDRLAAVDDRDGYLDVRDWVEANAPAEADGEDGYDHVPGLLTQLSREPLERPTLTVADKPIDELGADDITLSDYESHDGLRFSVAE